MPESTEFRGKARAGGTAAEGLGALAGATTEMQKRKRTQKEGCTHKR